MRTLVLSCCVMLLAACAGQGTIQNETREPRRVETDTSANTRPEADQPSMTDVRSKAKIHVELGNAYLESARFGIALDEAKVAIGYDNTYAPAHLLLALVYTNLDQFDQATPAFEQAARLAPGDPEINNSYGWFLCTRGREQEGLIRLDQAARNPYYPTPTRAYTNAGLCHLRKNDYVAAEAQFQRAYQIDPINRQALYQLAATNYKLGNYILARQSLSKLQGMMTSPVAETLWLGLRIERKLGNRDGEGDYAFRLRRDFASSPEYQAFLQGKYE